MNVNNQQVEKRDIRLPMTEDHEKSYKNSNQQKWCKAILKSTKQGSVKKLQTPLKKSKGMNGNKI